MMYDYLQPQYYRRDGKCTFHVSSLLSYYCLALFHLYLAKSHLNDTLHVSNTSYTVFSSMKKCPYNWTHYSNKRVFHYSLTMKLVMNIKGHLMLCSLFSCVPFPESFECNNWTSVLNAIKATSVRRYAIHVYLTSLFVYEHIINPK